VFLPLLKPSRYKGAHGGRGGAAEAITGTARTKAIELWKLIKSLL